MPSDPQPSEPRSEYVEVTAQDGTVYEVRRAQPSEPEPLTASEIEKAATTLSKTYEYVYYLGDLPSGAHREDAEVLLALRFGPGLIAGIDSLRLRAERAEEERDTFRVELQGTDRVHGALQLGNEALIADMATLREQVTRYREALERIAGLLEGNLDHEFTARIARDALATLTSSEGEQ